MGSKEHRKTVHPACPPWESQKDLFSIGNCSVNYLSSWIFVRLFRITCESFEDDPLTMSWGLPYSNHFDISNTISVSDWKWIQFIDLYSFSFKRWIDQLFFFSQIKANIIMLQLKDFWQYSAPSTCYLIIYEIIYQKQADRDLILLLLPQAFFASARQNLICLNLDIRFE